MKFRPPLLIKNLLPFKIILVLADTTNGLDAPVFEVGVGGSVEVHEFDMTRKIHMSIQLKVWSVPAESLPSINLRLIFLAGKMNIWVKRGSPSHVTMSILLHARPLIACTCTDELRPSNFCLADKDLVLALKSMT